MRAFHRSTLIAFSHQFLTVWVDISCFVHFISHISSWNARILPEITEINFWALALLSSKVFLSKDQKYTTYLGLKHFRISISDISFKQTLQRETIIKIYWCTRKKVTIAARNFISCFSCILDWANFFVATIISKGYYPFLNALHLPM